MKPIKVALLGIGTVGSGVFNVLQRNQKEIQARTGRGIEIALVADRNIAHAESIVEGRTEIIDDAFTAVERADIDIVVELIGGYTVAKELVLQAIANGKHVVTANKALLAVHGTEIFAAANKAGVVVAYEAAVAGGIPIIKALREGLSANRIDWVAGIINGTTNFILSEMLDKGQNFDQALSEAQRLGYAEADPTFDIEGVDAAHKITLLSSLAFGIPVQFDKAYVEGVTKLAANDIKYAQQLGYRIKLLGITRRRQQGVELRVHPTLIPNERLIASVEGAMNAVVVHADALGESLYYGAGAGSEPTASAVIADLVDVTRLCDAEHSHRVPSLAFQPDSINEQLYILPMAEVLTSYYLRLRVADQTGVLTKVTGILSEAKISIDAIVQREADKVSGEGGKQTDVIILTHECKEALMNQAVAAIQKLPTVLEPIVLIRKEELG